MKKTLLFKALLLTSAVTFFEHTTCSHVYSMKAEEPQIAVMLDVNVLRNVEINGKSLKEHFTNQTDSSCLLYNAWYCHTGSDNEVFKAGRVWNKKSGATARDFRIEDINSKKEEEKKIWKKYHDFFSKNTSKINLNEFLKDIQTLGEIYEIIQGSNKEHKDIQYVNHVLNILKEIEKQIEKIIQDKQNPLTLSKHEVSELKKVFSEKLEKEPQKKEAIAYNDYWYGIDAFCIGDKRGSSLSTRYGAEITTLVNEEKKSCFNELNKQSKKLINKIVDQLNTESIDVEKLYKNFYELQSCYDDFQDEIDNLNAGDHVTKQQNKEAIRTASTASILTIQQCYGKNGSQNSAYINLVLNQLKAFKKELDSKINNSGAYKKITTEQLQAFHKNSQEKTKKIIECVFFKEVTEKITQKNKIDEKYCKNILDKQKELENLLADPAIQIFIVQKLDDKQKKRLLEIKLENTEFMKCLANPFSIQGLNAFFAMYENINELKQIIRTYLEGCAYNIHNDKQDGLDDISDSESDVGKSEIKEIKMHNKEDKEIEKIVDRKRHQKQKRIRLFEQKQKMLDPVLKNLDDIQNNLNIMYYHMDKILKDAGIVAYVRGQNESGLKDDARKIVYKAANNFFKPRLNDPRSVEVNDVYAYYKMQSDPIIKEKLIIEENDYTTAIKEINKLLGNDQTEHSVIEIREDTDDTIKINDIPLLNAENYNGIYVRREKIGKNNSNVEIAGLDETKKINPMWEYIKEYLFENTDDNEGNNQYEQTTIINLNESSNVSHELNQLRAVYWLEQAITTYNPPVGRFTSDDLENVSAVIRKDVVPTVVSMLPSGFILGLGGVVAGTIKTWTTSDWLSGVISNKIESLISGGGTSSDSSSGGSSSSSKRFHKIGEKLLKIATISEEQRKEETQKIETLLQNIRIVRNHLMQKIDANNKKLLKDTQTLIKQRIDNFENFKNKTEVWILSLDGGGLKGLIGATLMEQIENYLTDACNKHIKIQDLFDFYAGTSTGGLQSIALTTPKFGSAHEPMHGIDVVKGIYKEKGSVIFPQLSGMQKGLGKLTYAYYPYKLEETLYAYFYNNPLCYAIKPTLVTAVTLTEDKNPLRYFKSYDPFIYNSKTSKEGGYGHIEARYGARATSAAPTYFPPLTLCYNDMMQQYVDGGVAKNNPTDIALREALKLCKNVQKITIFSIGTGLQSHASGFLHEKTGHIVNTLKTLAGSAMETSVLETERAMDDLIEFAKGRGVAVNYVRFNPELRTDIEMDNSDPKVLAEFEKLVNKMELNKKFEDDQKFPNTLKKEIAEAEKKVKKLSSNIIAKAIAPQEGKSVQQLRIDAMCNLQLLQLRDLVQKMREKMRGKHRLELKEKMAEVDGLNKKSHNSLRRTKSFSQ